MHKALGTDEQGAVRFSFSWFNTQEEVEQAVDASTWRGVAQPANSSMLALEMNSLRAFS